MKRIYLDQNKWVDLAAAEKHLPKGAAFEEVSILLRAGVLARDVSLPLSSAHYIETSNRRHWESRRDLALTMAAFSQMHAIAPAHALVPAELDRALQHFCGRPHTLRPLRPFGKGASHALGIDMPPYRVPDDVAARLADRWGFERGVNEFREVALLVGPSPDDEAELGPDYKPLSHLMRADEYARGKQTLREERAAAGWHKGERARRVGSAQAYADHLDVINEAFERADVPAGLLLAGGQNRMNEFLEAVPTIFASSELERLRHSSSQKPWERQDLMDIAALAVASVYCDIVVTERFWVDAAERAGFDERFGTTFLRRLDALPEHLL